MTNRPIVGLCKGISPRHLFSCVAANVYSQSYSGILSIATVYVFVSELHNANITVQDVSRQKTRDPELFCSVVCTMINLVILLEIRLVTDRRTDRRRAILYIPRKVMRCCMSSSETDGSASMRLVHRGQWTAKNRRKVRKSENDHNCSVYS